MKVIQSILFSLLLMTANSQNSSGIYIRNDTMFMLKSDGSSVQLTKLPPTIKTINGVDISGAGNVAIAGVNSTITFLPNDVVNNNASANTIADVTGLSFAVSAGITYKFKAFVVYSSAATTTGSRWSINGPATTFMHYRSTYTLTATSETTNSGVSAYNSPSGSNASSLLSNNIAIIEGVVRPSANGTVIVRFASEISGSAITAIAGGKSYIEFQAIN